MPRVIVLILVLLACAGCARGRDEAVVDGFLRRLRQPITVRFEDVALSDAASYIAAHAGVSVVIEPWAGSGTPAILSVSAKDMPLLQLLDRISRATKQEWRIRDFEKTPHGDTKWAIIFALGSRQADETCYAEVDAAVEKLRRELRETVP